MQDRLGLPTISPMFSPKLNSQQKLRFGPDGIHLFDRVHGLNILLDEVQVPPQDWSRAPRQLSIALTNACDLACPYCYAPKTLATLKADCIKQWLTELDLHGCLGIGFGGGEPTLYKQLPEICHYAICCTQLAVTFTTHAHHLNETLIQELKGNIHFIRVSMDGVEATYEKLRGRSFSVFQQKLRTIGELTRFGINYVVNKQTFPDLQRAIQIAIDLNASEFLLLPEQPVAGQGGIDVETRQALYKWVDTYQNNIPITISAGSHSDIPLCDPLPKETGLRAYAHIDAHGVLKPSSYSRSGISIDKHGIIHTLEKLRVSQLEAEI